MAIMEAKRRILTPRVDMPTSVQQPRSTVGENFLSNIAEITSRAAEEERREQLALDKQIARARKERETAVRKVLVNEASLEFDGALEQFTQGYRASKAQNPMGTQQDYKNKALRHLDAFAKTIEDDQVRMAFRADALNQIRNRSVGHAKWEAAQSVDLSKDSTIRQGGILAQQAYEAGRQGNEGKLQGIIGKLPQLMGSYQSSGAVDDLNAMSATLHENIASGYVYGMIQENPIKAKHDLEGGRFDQLLSAKQIKQLTSDAQRATASLEKKLRLDLFAEQASEAPGLMDKAIRGELTLPEVDERIRTQGATEYNKQLRTLVLEGRPADAITDSIAYIEIADDYGILLDKIEDGDLEGEEAYQSLMDINTKLMRRVNEGKISFRDYEKDFLQRMIAPLTDEVNAITGRRGPFEITGEFIKGSTNPKKEGLRAIEKWIKDAGQKDNKRLKKRMISTFLERLNGLEEQRGKGKEVSIDDLIDEMRRNGQRILNPNAHAIGDSYVDEVSGTPVRVIGIQPDGQELLDVVE